MIRVLCRLLARQLVPGDPGWVDGMQPGFSSEFQERLASWWSNGVNDHAIFAADADPEGSIARTTSSHRRHRGARTVGWSCDLCGGGGHGWPALA